MGAHTTASDALWAGLPVLTLAGRAFPARVGASLLHAVGLADMVTASAAEYEARALELALDPTTHPLFNTAAHTRALEAAYRAALDRARAGMPPDHLEIA